MAETHKGAAILFDEFQTHPLQKNQPKARLTAVLQSTLQKRDELSET
jgi:hypothetical protein